MVLGQTLEKWNVICETAANGREALEMASQHDYNLILMDLMMPIMDGYECVRHIRALNGSHSQVPVIALSASVSNEVVERVVDAGMDDYLCKPFDPVDLYRKLNKFSNRDHLKPVHIKPKR